MKKLIATLLAALALHAQAEVITINRPRMQPQVFDWSFLQVRVSHSLLLIEMELFQQSHARQTITEKPFFVVVTRL